MENKTKKLVITATNAVEFEQRLNEHDGFATQISTCVDNNGVVHYTGVIFIKVQG
jgi:hypothetical protein